MVRVNLLPASRPSRIDFTSGVHRTFLLGAIAVFLLLALVPITLDLWSGRVTDDNKVLTDKIATWSASVARIVPLKAEYKLLSERLTWYYGVAGTGLDTGAILKEVQVTIPADVWLTSMSFAVDGTASVVGLAMGYDAVGQFMSQLKLSPVFAYVELITSQVQKIGDSEAVSFQLKANINRV